MNRRILSGSGLGAFMIAAQLCTTNSLQAESQAWYEVLNRPGKGGIRSVEQGGPGLPLIITVDEASGPYVLDLVLLANLDEQDAVIGYSMDVIAPQSHAVWADELVYLSGIGEFDDAVLGGGPGPIVDDAGEFSFFVEPRAGLMELFGFTLHVNAAAGEEIELYSGIGYFGWAPTDVAELPIGFAGATPVDAVIPDLVCDAPSIIIRVGEVTAPVDCNGNGVSDAADLAVASSADCNTNGVPDECDFGRQTSRDCDGNGVPDECDLGQGAADCDANGVQDSCDLSWGTLADINGNAVPDVCEPAPEAESTDNAESGSGDMTPGSDPDPSNDTETGEVPHGDINDAGLNGLPIAAETDGNPIDADMDAQPVVAAPHASEAPIPNPLQTAGMSTADVPTPVDADNAPVSQTQTSPKWVDRNLLHSVLRQLFVVDVGRISILAPLGPILFGPLGINFSAYVIAYDLFTAPIRPWLCDNTYNLLNLWMP